MMKWKKGLTVLSPIMPVYLPASESSRFRGSIIEIGCMCSVRGETESQHLRSQGFATACVAEVAEYVNFE